MTQHLDAGLSELTRSTKNPVGQKCLDEALRQLAELDDYAETGEHLPPSPTAKKSAQNLLGILARKAPRDYMISLWEDGDVVVYSGGAGWRVDIYCRANGGAAFYVSSPDKRDYEGHYQSAQDMPASLIIDALKNIPA